MAESQRNILIVVKNPNPSSVSSSSSDESSVHTTATSTSSAIRSKKAILPVSVSGSFLLDTTRRFRFMAQSLDATTGQEGVGEDDESMPVEMFRLPSFTPKEIADCINRGVDALEHEILTQILDNSSSVRAALLEMEERSGGSPHFITAPKIHDLEYLDEEGDWITLVGSNFSSAGRERREGKEEEGCDNSLLDTAFTTLSELLQSGNLPHLRLRVIAHASWHAFSAHQQQQPSALTGRDGASVVLGTVVVAPPTSGFDSYHGEEDTLAAAANPDEKFAYSEEEEGDRRIDDADDEGFPSKRDTPISAAEEQRMTSNTDLSTDVDLIDEYSSTDVDVSSSARHHNGRGRNMLRNNDTHQDETTGNNISPSLLHTRTPPPNSGEAQLHHLAAPPIMNQMITGAAPPCLHRRRPPLHQLTTLNIPQRASVPPLSSPNPFSEASPVVVSRSSPSYYHCPMEPATPRVSHCPSLKTPLQNFAGWFGF